MHNHVCICSKTYCVYSQICHVVYLNNDFFQGCKHVANEKPTVVMTGGVALNETSNAS